MISRSSLIVILGMLITAQSYGSEPLVGFCKLSADYVSQDGKTNLSEGLTSLEKVALTDGAGSIELEDDYIKAEASISNSGTSSPAIYRITLALKSVPEGKRLGFAMGTVDSTQKDDLVLAVAADKEVTKLNNDGIWNLEGFQVFCRVGRLAQ